MRTFAVMAVALVMGIAVVSPAASASDAEAEGEGEVAGAGSTGEGEITLTGRFDISSTISTAVQIQDVWLWRKGRRMFTLSHVPGGGSSTDLTRVVSYDLDGGGEVGRQLLNRQYPSREGGQNASQFRRALHAAVDEDGGRLFVPYANANETLADVSPVAAARDGGRCVGTGRCLVAVGVVDAVTLDEVARVPLGALSVDGGALTAPRLVAMSYAPPGAPGEAGKVLLLLGEGLTRENPPWTASANGSVHYVAQLDPDARRVDWVTRVDGCRATRRPVPPGNLESPEEINAFEKRSNEAVVFRGGPAGARAVWVGCQQSSRTGVVVKVPLDEHGFPASVPYAPGDAGVVAAKSGRDARSVGRDDLLRPSPAAGQQVFVGPKEAREFVADPVSERVLVRVVDGQPRAAEVWWVFDGRREAFIGTIGIGAYQTSEGFTERGQLTTSGLDPSSGRFYVLAPRLDALRSGGLFVVDVRRTPVPQALVFPQFAELLLADQNGVPIQVDYGAKPDPAFRRLLVRKGSVYGEFPQHRLPYYDVLHDRVPVTVDPEADLFTGRSVDLDEVEGVTRASFDAAARGFAARLLMVGGVGAAGRAGPADFTGVEAISASQSWAGLELSPCSAPNRQVVVGFVGPRDAAVVDGNGSRGGAEALVVDSGTRGDGDVPVSRCGPTANGTPWGVPRLGKLDWHGVWSKGLVARPPVEEPGAPWLFGDGGTECVSSDAQPSASFGDPVTSAFASRVDCREEDASGYGYARGVGVGDVSVSEAVSQFRIYRDPGRGIVARVESIARGVDIGGVVSVDTIRGVAESWANGRRQPVDEQDRGPGYDANCDGERTAGTCFSRSIFGVRTPAYSCGPCGDEQALVNAISRAFGGNGRVRLRDPDPLLRRGAPNGYIAAIQKPAHERFGDVALHDDLLQTVVPVLEIVRYAIPAGSGGQQPLTDGRRGLQVLQFAGVEVSSSYGIQCLLVYDADANSCGDGPARTGGLQVRLEDLGQSPLPGGVFAVRADNDGDGVAGLADELVAGGVCVTAQDGVGTCRFDRLPVGRYLVSQTAAPSGFAPVAEAFAVAVDADALATVTFVNASNLSTVRVTATDEAGAPVAGAAFAVFPDADADGKIAPDTPAAASCVTGPDGTCAMTVPIGGYVLVQSGAPEGLVPIDPVAFALTSGGQLAAVAVVNARADAGTPPAPPPSPAVVDLSTVTATAPTIAAAPELASPPHQPAATPAAVAARLGGTVVRVVRAPGDLSRLLARRPLEGAALTAVAWLFAAAVAATRRRLLLAGLLTMPATAPARPRPHQPASPPDGPPHRPHPARPRSILPEIAGAAPSSASATLRVALASPDTHARQLMAARLSGDQRVHLAGLAADWHALTAIVTAERVDIVVVDAALAVPGGALWQALARIVPIQRVVGVAAADDRLAQAADQARAAGVRGFLALDDDMHNGHLAYTLRSVAAGNPCYGPTVQHLLFERPAPTATGDAGSPITHDGHRERLTPRELEIARLAAQGLRRNDIARHLYVSHVTVKTHLRAARAKLGVTDPWNTDELRERLAQLSLLDPPDDGH